MDAKKKAKLRREIKALVKDSIAPLVVEVITQRLTQYAEVLHDEHFSIPASEDSAGKDGERLVEWIIETAEWFRDEGRTHLAIRVADGADLSCKAFRRGELRAAFDAAREAAQASDTNQENQ